MSDFRFQSWPETIAIATLLEFCSWLFPHDTGGDEDAKQSHQDHLSYQNDNHGQGYVNWFPQLHSHHICAIFYAH
jgi:hypothetical protein